MSDKRKPGGACGTEPGNEIDTCHYPPENAARQRGRLLAYLQSFGSVSTLEARADLSIMHPAARVHELRRGGWTIKTVWDELPDDTGGVHRVGRYLLGREVRP